jgi:HD domain
MSITGEIYCFQNTMSSYQLQSTLLARETVRTIAGSSPSEFENLFFPPQLRQYYFPEWSIPEMQSYLGGLRRAEGRIVTTELNDNEIPESWQREGIPVFSPSDLNLIKSVAEQAARAHDGQVRKRSGASYFSEHVLRVVQFTVEAAIRYENACADLGVGEKDRYVRLNVPLILAALLHDVVEDSQVSQNQLERVVSGSEDGKRGAHLAAFLTKHDWRRYPGDPETDKKSMKEQAELFYYNRLSKAPLEAVLIKVCDRMANLSSDWVTPNDDFPTYALETQRPFSYLCARLVAALPEGGVMRELQEQFDSLLLRIVETSLHSERAVEALLKEREISVFEQGFLDPEFDYDAVRYQTTEMVRGLIPEMERAIAEILEVRDPESREVWTRILVFPLNLILQEQERSEAVRVLKMNVLTEACHSVVSDLAENPLTIRLLLPKLVSSIVTFGDSDAASRVNQWGKQWLTAITNALTQLREIGLLESSLLQLHKGESVSGDTNRIVGDLDLIRLKLIRSFNSIYVMRERQALESLERNFLGTQHNSFRSDLSQILLLSLLGTARTSSVSEQNNINFNDPSSEISVSKSFEPNREFLELLDCVKAYADGLREIYSNLNSQATSTVNHTTAPFFTSLWPGEQIHFNRDATLYDVIQGLRTFVPLWRSHSRGKNLPVTVSIESPEAIQRSLSCEEASADQPFFEVLRQLTNLIWVGGMEKIEVVSLLQQPGKGISRETQQITFDDLTKTGDYHLSSGGGNLVASFYRWYPAERVSNGNGITPPLYFSGRIRMESLVPDSFVKLVAATDIPLEAKPEILLCKAPGIRQYRITMVTDSVDEARALTQRYLSDEVLEFKGDPPIKLLVSDFGASLEPLATGGGERYYWLVNNEIIIEFRIHDQRLVKDEERRFNEELEERARSVQADRDPWMPYVRSFAAAILQGKQPELEPNPYLRVVGPLWKKLLP